jgi:hypothetical protein
LVWLALILVIAGVVYFTPRFADYVASEQAEPGRGAKPPHVMAFRHFGTHHGDR